MKLVNFKKDFDRGRPIWVEALWVLSSVLFSSWIPGSSWRRQILKLFGAKIGSGVVIKPHVRIKFPWRLEIGNDSWIGEGVWIDNLTQVQIANDVCISQGAYLCTGSHDYRDPAFRLIVKPIVIEERSWICAFAKIAPGVCVKRKSVVGLGAVLTRSTEEGKIYQGNPAAETRERNEG